MENTIIADTDEKVAMFRLAAIKGGVKLETLGMKRRGSSAYAVAKKLYHLKGNKAQVLSQLIQMIEDVTLGKRTALSCSK